MYDIETLNITLSKERSSQARVAWLILILAAVYFIAALVLYGVFLKPIISSMYAQQSYPFLNQFMHHRDTTPLSSYVRGAGIWFSRLSLIVIIAAVALAAAIAQTSTRRIIVNFFATPTSPVNLAIFRIAMFAATLAVLRNDIPATILFGSFPHQLQFAPFGVGWLLPYLPISKPLVILTSTLLVVACLAGLIGLFARFSALLAAVLGFYVLGIPQFYGKVSHVHELIWFTAILAASPCGDALSIDAILSSKQRADRGIIEPIRPSIVYALPLRFASLLLGVIYFFPGFWKLWTSGFAWALSDNLKFQMYSKWMEFTSWTPVFRLDRHPWLYRPLALETMVFEMSFIFLIFSPRLRRVAALGGVAFHVGSLIFLQIFFYDLLLCYVALFDVSGWLRKLGVRVFKVPLTFFYDGDCRRCRRTIAAIRTMDVLGRITYVDAREQCSRRVAGATKVYQSLSVDNLLAVSGDQSAVGFAACRMMALRVPILWPVVPFLFLPPIAKIGNATCRRVTRSPSSNLTKKQTSTLAASHEENIVSRTWKPVVGIGLLLLAGNIYAGAHGIVSGWPFACYPTFAGIEQDTITSLGVVAIAANGEPIPEPSALKQKFMDQRLRGLFETLLKFQNQAGSDERLRALWQVYAKEDSQLGGAAAVRFYRLTMCTIPEKRYLNPMHRELIEGITL